MDRARVLIIEDDPHIRETMRLALETEGYDVGTAATGPDGLEQFGSGAGWNLVLLDQRMPGMDGVEVLHQIRLIDQAIPVVLVTAYSTVNLARDVLALGASGFLSKPISPEELRTVVHDLLVTRHRSPGYRLKE
jgi:CheY-like chemotaxis protein